MKKFLYLSIFLFLFHSRAFGWDTITHIVIAEKAANSNEFMTEVKNSFPENSMIRKVFSNSEYRSLLLGASTFGDLQGSLDQIYKAFHRGGKNDLYGQDKAWKGSNWPLPPVAWWGRKASSGKELPDDSTLKDLFTKYPAPPRIIHMGKMTSSLYSDEDRGCRLLAVALGWASHVAADNVAHQGNSFVNSYKMWSQDVINNFADTLEKLSKVKFQINQNMLSKWLSTLKTSVVDSTVDTMRRRDYLPGHMFNEFAVSRAIVKNGTMTGSIAAALKAAAGFNFTPDEAKYVYPGFNYDAKKSELLIKTNVVLTFTPTFGDKTLDSDDYKITGKAWTGAGGVNDSIKEVIAEWKNILQNIK